MASSSTQALLSAQKTESPRTNLPATEVSEPSSSQGTPEIPLQDEAAYSAFQVFARSTLYRLSPELRNRVYSYALAPDGKFRVVTIENGIPEPAVLFTCKHIRKEAIGIFYNENKFLLTMRDYHPAVQLLWNRKTDALSHNINISKKVYWTKERGVKHWNNLKKSLRVIHSQRIEIEDQENFDTDLSTNAREEENFRVGLEIMASMMKSQPWQQVEKVVDSLRIGLIKINRAWAIDYTDSD